jgi:hypothetical protein
MNKKFKEIDKFWPVWNRCDYTMGNSLPSATNPEYNRILARTVQSIPEQELFNLFDSIEEE